jgi:hypothetical protein
VSALNGVYRVTWTEQELVAAGTSTDYAKHNHSTITLTLRDGRFQEHWSIPPDCAGTYTVTRNTVTIRFTHGCSGWVRARWSLTRTALRLRILDGSDKGTEIQFGAKPWRKVG